MNETDHELTSVQKSSCNPIALWLFRACRKSKIRLLKIPLNRRLKDGFTKFSAQSLAAFIKLIRDELIPYYSVSQAPIQQIFTCCRKQIHHLSQFYLTANHQLKAKSQLKVKNKLQRSQKVDQRLAKQSQVCCWSRSRVSSKPRCWMRSSH